MKKWVSYTELYFFNDSIDFNESIWIKFQKYILSRELIWINSCKATDSHVLIRIKTFWDWAESNLFFLSYPCLHTSNINDGVFLCLAQPEGLRYASNVIYSFQHY